MANVIEVVYQNGVFKPVTKVHFKERVRGYLILTNTKGAKKSLFGSVPDLKKFTEKDRADAE